MIEGLRKFRKYKAPYLFISPFFIIFTAFTIIPIIYSLWMSFHKLVGINVPLKFIGFKNYIALVQNPKFIHSLKVTFTYTISHVSIMVVLAIILALILNLDSLKGRNIYRLTFFLPVITSFVAAGMIFKLLLDRDMGLLNIILRMIGLKGYAWLDVPNLALPSLIAIGTWRWVGYQMVILLAGLQNIPKELYDAARVDGAGILRVIFRITLPLLFPVIFFVIIMSVIGSLQLFDEPYILNIGETVGGGPADSMLSVAIYLYQTGFVNFRLGYASAMGYVLTIIIFIVSIFQIRLLGKKAGFQ